MCTDELAWSAILGRSPHHITPNKTSMGSYRAALALVLVMHRVRSVHGQLLTCTGAVQGDEVRVAV